MGFLRPALLLRPSWLVPLALGTSIILGRTFRLFIPSTSFGTRYAFVVLAVKSSLMDLALEDVSQLHTSFITLSAAGGASETSWVSMPHERCRSKEAYQ